MYYLCTTFYGTSGSPVFNDHWELVGMHHWGNDRLDPPALTDRGLRVQNANRGIALSSICNAIATEAIGAKGP